MLRVWLPLTKDTRQQGLSNISVTGSPASWGNGKLGKCATWNGTVANVLYNNTTDFNYTDNFSVAFWINPVFTSGSTQYAWTVGRADAGGYGYGFQIANATDGYFRFGNGTYAVNMPSNQWNHYVMTVGNNKVTTYKNGVQTSQNNLPGTLPTYSDGNGMGLGCFHYSGNIYPFYGSINDFRIYDHCLSPMEVKELAKGLVLHYPLNRQGWGQNNLIITNSMAPTSGTNGWNSAGTGWANSNVTASGASNGHAIRCTYSGTTQVSGGIHHPTGVDKTTLTNGATYTLTARIRASKACIATFQNELMTTGNTINLTTDWKIYSYSCVIDNTKTYQSNVIYVRAADATQDMWIECDWIKLEEGTKATPWIPNLADPLYTTMGLNSTTEYDCSGFCNNGSKMTDTITYNSDTAKYAVSTHFNGTYDGIIIENLALKDMINSAITYAFWIKPESESGARSVYFGSYSGISWSVEKTAGNQLRLYWNSSPDETCSGAIITDGVWQHICITKSGTNDVKVYINGVQKWTSTATHSSLNFPTTYRIGRDTRSNDGTPYKGLMSDFRIYATALSADDVKSLYQNSAYIDSSGNVYGAVHSEA